MGTMSGATSQIVVFEGIALHCFLGLPGGPWWLASPICRLLGPPSPKRALSRLAADEKGIVVVAGGDRHRHYADAISESGLYRLLYTSTRDVAPRFRAWLFRDVLPKHPRPASLVSVGSEHAEAADMARWSPAASWLSEYLGDQELPSTTVLAEAKLAGFDRKSIYRAKEVLGVVSTKEGFHGGAWFWKQPAARKTAPPIVAELMSRPIER